MVMLVMMVMMMQVLAACKHLPPLILQLTAWH